MVVKRTTASKKNPRIGKGLFAALLVSHQFTPALTAVKWSLQMLADGKFGQVNSGQKAILEKAIKKNEALIALMDRVLSIAKLSESKDAYVKAPARLEEVLSLEMENIAELAAQKHITITATPAASLLPTLMLDREMMRLAVHNILDNAIKYTPAGKTIEVSVKAGENTVELAVKDSGIGIPKNQQSKLFGMFSRADNASAANAKGSGLGLFIAKEIVEAHDGKIWFDSVEGEGTTFHIAFPIKKVE